MSVLHVLRVPSHVVSELADGEPRWCFYCRQRVAFARTIYAPDDPMSYYGQHGSVKCENGHEDGDLFPGRWREWGDSPSPAATAPAARTEPGE
jgi:hypothetical protein